LPQLSTLTVLPDDLQRARPAATTQWLIRKKREPVASECFLRGKEEQWDTFSFKNIVLTDLISKLPLALDNLMTYTNNENEFQKQIALTALFCEPSTTKRRSVSGMPCGGHQLS
jgi:hypothetical protein